MPAAAAVQQHQQQAPTNTAPSAGVRRQNPPAPARKERPPSPPPTLHDASGTRSTFKVGHLLGEGGFARCFAVTDQDGNRLAVKVVHKPSLKSTKQRNKLLSEIKIHKSLSHPGVVKFHHVFEDDVNVYMILELCENRTLADMLKKRKRLTELEVRYYMHQLLDSIRYMHRHGVIHRDIKLGNLFLAKNMSLKIGDFGLAAVIKHDGERKKTICGTPNYIAPEVLFNKEGHSFEVDVWSLGIVMYTLVIGKPPFQTNDVNSIYERIRENNYEFPPSIPISNDVRTIIQSLLNSNPEHRPSIDDVLEHPFFASEPIPIQIPVSALLSPPVIEASNLTRLNNVAYNTSSSSSSGSGSGNSIGNGGGGGGAAQTVAPDYHYPAPSGSAHAYDGPQQQQPSEPPLATLIDRSSPQNDARGHTRPFHDPSRVPGAIRAQRTKSALSMDRLSVGNAPAQGQTRPPASVDRANIGVVSSPWSPPRDQQPWAGLMAPDQRQSATAPAAPVPAPATRSLTTPPPTSAVNSQAAAAAGSAGMLATSEMPRTRNRSPTAPAAEPVASGWPDQAPPLPKRLSGVVPGQTTPSSLLSPAKAKLLQILSVALDKRAGGSGGSNSPVDNLSSGLEAFGLNGSGSSLAHPDLFVTKWIDYSNKYGLGYQLRDGSVGVYFNDSTSIILAADGMHFEYLHCGKALDKAAMHREAYTLEQ
ncbi:kinase-like domain-containing protein, partial [Entophlyctis helioformis]